MVNDGGILIKSGNCVGVRIRQLKIKDIKVFFDALSFASLKGPPLCQKHGTTSRPLRPAGTMISEGLVGVKYVGADG